MQINELKHKSLNKLLIQAFYLAYRIIAFGEQVVVRVI